MKSQRLHSALEYRTPVEYGKLTNVAELFMENDLFALEKDLKLSDYDRVLFRTSEIFYRF